MTAVAEVVSLRSENYGHHHRIKWLDHYENALPVGTKLYTPPRPVSVPYGRIDSHCVQFMSLALRRTEYKKGSKGPNCDDIHLGVTAALAAAPAPAKASGA